MLSFFKPSKKNLHKKKGNSFYHRENIILTIDDLNNILKHFDSESLVPTNRKIQILGNDIDSINLKSIKTFFNEESYILEEPNFIDNHNIYYYRNTSQQFKFLTQLHFCGKEFFLGATKVYADHIFSEKEKKDLLKSITNKYCPDKNCDKKEVDIIDNDGNLLSTYDDIYFYIRYVPNTDTIKKLKMKFRGYVKQDPRNKMKEELDRLI